jgi:uncharacterized protein (TIGR02271 family)
VNTQQMQDITGKNVIDTNDDKVGEVGQIYLNDASGEPEWVTVKTGLFGSKESFVPIAGSQVTADGFVVAYDKSTIKDAPQVDADGHLSEQEMDELYRYYRLEGTAAQGQGQGREETNTQGQDTSGPNTDTAMTRSEERLHVGTEKQEAGRVRLRKYVVTENVTQTVPVTHEEVRVEREPITDANRDAALEGPAISEEEHEVVLSEERVVTAKETVPVERVKLSKESVTEDQDVSEEVRSERIETEGDVDVRGQEAARTQRRS